MGCIGAEGVFDGLRSEAIRCGPVPLGSELHGGM